MPASTCMPFPLPSHAFIYMTALGGTRRETLLL